MKWKETQGNNMQEMNEIKMNTKMKWMECMERTWKLRWNEHEYEMKWNEKKRTVKKRKENDLERIHELMNDWIKEIDWINWLN